MNTPSCFFGTASMHGYHLLVLSIVVDLKIVYICLLSLRLGILPCMQCSFILPYFHVVVVICALADASTFNRRSDCKKDVNGKGKESEHASPSSSAKEPNIKVESNTSSSKVRIFAYQQLVDATENFRSDCFLGEGGFGRVYKGQLADTNKVGL